MALENILKEIEERKKQKIANITDEYSKKVGKIIEESDYKIKELEKYYEYKKVAEKKSLKYRELETVTLEARKILVEKKNQLLQETCIRANQVFNNLKNSSYYPELLKTMLNTAHSYLGHDLIFYIRAEDRMYIEKSVNSEMVAKNIDPVGGILAESKDGTKELNMTFNTVFHDLKEQLIVKLLPYVRGY